MENLLEYINQRTKETNNSISLSKELLNQLDKPADPNWIKTTSSYSFYHQLLGELAILNEIKSKLKEDE
jgi:hypothetical protein